MRRGAIGLVALGTLSLPAAASADEQVVAGPLPSTFFQTQVQIDEGERLSFLNADLTAPHDVTSTERGLFASETVAAPSQAPVKGAESLAPGSYPFLCSIHPYMTGTLTVGDGSARPGDKRPPKASVRSGDKRVADVLGDGELDLRVKIDEPARVRVTAKDGRTKVAAGAARLGKGGGKLAAKLTSVGKRALKGSGRVKLGVAIKATDDAGNTGRSRDTLTLR